MSGTLTQKIQNDFDRIALLEQVKWDHNSHYHNFLLKQLPPHCESILEVQMIVDFYAPSISESVEDLYGLMNCYWGHFHVVLVIEQKGEKVDHTTPSYLKAVKYSRMIPSKVYNIRQKIGKIAHSVIDL